MRARAQDSDSTTLETISNYSSEEATQSDEDGLATPKTRYASRASIASRASRGQRSPRRRSSIGGPLSPLLPCHRRTSSTKVGVIREGQPLSPRSTAFHSNAHFNRNRRAPLWGNKLNFKRASLLGDGSKLSTLSSYVPRLVVNRYLFGGRLIGTANKFSKGAAPSTAFTPPSPTAYPQSPPKSGAPPSPSLSPSLSHASPPPSPSSPRTPGPTKLRRTTSLDKEAADKVTRMLS